MFAVLEYGSISRTLLDSEMHTKERDELKLLPRQLCLLLRDLSHKLSTSLSLFGSRGLKVSSAESHNVELVQCTM